MIVQSSYIVDRTYNNVIIKWLMNYETICEVSNEKK